MNRYCNNKKGLKNKAMFIFSVNSLVIKCPRTSNNRASNIFLSCFIKIKRSLQLINSQLKRYQRRNFYAAIRIKLRF